MDTSKYRGDGLEDNPKSVDILYPKRYKRLPNGQIVRILFSEGIEVKP